MNQVVVQNPLVPMPAEAELTRKNPEVVARVLNGVVPHLMITDPPYGVSYDPAKRGRSGENRTKRIGKVANDDRG